MQEHTSRWSRSGRARRRPGGLGKRRQPCRHPRRPRPSRRPRSSGFASSAVGGSGTSGSARRHSASTSPKREPPRESYVQHGGNEPAASRRWTLLDLPEPPTAIVASTDVLAIGMLHAAHERGPRVPDQSRSQASTTSRGRVQRAVPDDRSHARREMIDGRAKASTPDHAGERPPPVLQPELVVRASTGRAPRGDSAKRRTTMAGRYASASTSAPSPVEQRSSMSRPGRSSRPRLRVPATVSSTSSCRPRTTTSGSSPTGLCRTLRTTSARFRTQSLRAAQSGVDPADVIGIGIDFTACTMLPTKADGTPLCTLPEYRRHPHAWVKLWKHHAAQPVGRPDQRLAPSEASPGCRAMAADLLRVVFSKALQILDEAPDIYDAADRLIEAADWVVWQLTGVETRNNCTAGYKAIWSKRDGFPSDAILRGPRSALRAYRRREDVASHQRPSASGPAA